MGNKVIRPFLTPELEEHRQTSNEQRQEVVNGRQWMDRGESRLRVFALFPPQVYLIPF